MIEPTERILVLGDIHGYLWQVEKAVLLAHESEINTILQLGDFGIWPGRSGQEFLDRLDRMLEHFDVNIYFVDGNHEDFPQLYAYPLNEDGTRQVRQRIMHLPRGHRWTWHGVSFLAMGGAHSVDRPLRTPNLSWWSEEHITEGDVRRALDVENPYADVMVCHDSPTRAPNPVVDENRGARFWPQAELYTAALHRKTLQEIVDGVNPRRLWHGHYHSSMHGTFTTAAGYPCHVTGLDEGGNFEQACFIAFLDQLQIVLDEEKKVTV